MFLPKNKADYEELVTVYKCIISQWEQLLRDKLINESDFNWNTSQLKSALLEFEKVLSEMEKAEYDDNRALADHLTEEAESSM